MHVAYSQTGEFKKKKKAGRHQTLYAIVNSDITITLNKGKELCI